MKRYIAALSVMIALAASYVYWSQKPSLPPEAGESTDEMVENWEKYYPDASSSPENGVRLPANAFKYSISRGVSSTHKGIDYAAPCGTKVPARSAGTVTMASSRDGFGNVVGVRVGGCTQIYAHLSKISVKAGQRVTAGQLLGISGKTGRSFGPTGCHLHYEGCSKLYSQVTGDAPAKGKSKGKGKSRAKR